MRCFVHHDQEAVGVCCVCGKGLCPDCAVDLGDALSCRGACERKAREMRTRFTTQAIHAQLFGNQTLVNPNQALMRMARRATFLTPVLFIVIGIVLALLGFIGQRRFYFIPVSIGILFFVIGLVLFLFHRYLYKAVDRHLS